MVDLKSVRIAAGMTQMQLSEATGIKRTTIAMIELGENTPSIKTAKRLASVLDVNWFDFYEDGGEALVVDGSGSGPTLEG